MACARERRLVQKTGKLLIWDSSNNLDYRVVSITGWRYLENYETFAHRSGVYLLANADMHIKYVGKAGPGRMVAEIQSAISRGKDYGATRVKVLYTNLDERATSLEKDLIEKYNPPNNRT
jgi:excinuclease UvrABC nuclease subunit